MADFYDIDNNFTLDARGDITLKTDDDAIRQSIRQILFYQTGGKPGFGNVNENFGVGTNNFLFAPLTSFTAQVFAEEILRQLEAFETRITVEEVNVNSNITKKAFEIEIIYSVNKASELQTFRTVINQI